MARADPVGPGPSPARARVEDAGFTLCAQTDHGGLMGLKEELGRAGAALDPLLRAGGSVPRLVRGAWNRALAPLVGHSVLQVYRKQS